MLSWFRSILGTSPQPESPADDEQPLSYDEWLEIENLKASGQPVPVKKPVSHDAQPAAEPPAASVAAERSEKKPPPLLSLNPAAHYRIVYGDERAARDVKILCTSSRYFSAHCFLRGGQRTFRVDRVLQCVNLHDGSFVDSIVADAFESFGIRPKKFIMFARDLIDEEREMINLMVYLARLDGRMDASERSFILRMLGTLNDVYCLPDSFLDEQPEYDGDFDVYNMESELKSVKKIGDDEFLSTLYYLSSVSPDRVVRLHQLCHQMFFDRGTPHARELAALSIINDVIQKQAR